MIRTAPAPGKIDGRIRHAGRSLVPPIPPCSIGIVSLADVPLSAAAARFIETLP